MENPQKPSTWFWILVVLLLIWNAMGAMAYLGQTLITLEQLAILPEDQRMLIENTPSWVVSAFAIAVWGGLTASILMLLRKAFAHLWFIASMVGILGQMFYNFAIAGAYEVYGPGGLVMPVMVLFLGFYSIYYTKKAKDQGILR